MTSQTNEPMLASTWYAIAARPLSEQFLEWPADVFAVIAVILERSEAYRFALSPTAPRGFSDTPAPPGTRRLAVSSLALSDVPSDAVRRRPELTAIVQDLSHFAVDRHASIPGRPG